VDPQREPGQLDRYFVDVHSVDAAPRDLSPQQGAVVDAGCCRVEAELGSGDAAQAVQLHGHVR
jgi:hypothetical protein